MQQYFLFNGSFQPEDAPVIGPANRGLRYGDGLFETLKFINGELQLADAHFARLLRGMQVLGFRIPAHWSSEKVGEQCRALALKNGHAAGARVRINVIRGDGGLYDPVSHLPLILIQTWPLPSGAGTWNTNGLVLGICEGVRKSADVLANLKHNNYLGYVLAARQATDQKWNDALVMNTDGGICDTTIANLFAVRGQQIFTPRFPRGALRVLCVRVFSISFEAVTCLFPKSGSGPKIWSRPTNSLSPTASTRFAGCRHWAGGIIPAQ